MPIDNRNGTVTVGANYRWSSTRVQALNKGFPGGDLPSYGVLNAHLDWRNILGSGADLSIWGKNLTNTRYLDGTFAFEDAAGFRSGFPADPRTFGMTLSYRFGSEH